MHDVKINKSIHSYIDKAVIKLPITARLKQSGKFVSNSIETAKQIVAGDKVVIELGYGSTLTKEFEGFVSKVNFKSPCEIECEGFSWQLRESKSGLVKSWKTTTVKEILEFITQGTDIVLSKDIPNVPVKPMYIRNNNAVEVLDWLKEHEFLTVYFIDNVLYCGLEQTTQLDKVTKYRLGWNTIKDDDLKYRRADEVKIKVKAIYKDKNGKLQSKEFGEKGGLMRTLVFGREDDMKLLESKALAEAKKFRYEGYEGKITTFLIPFIQPGYKASLEDPKYTEKGGDYIAESLEVSFGRQGARRKIEIGKKVNKQK